MNSIGVAIMLAFVIGAFCAGIGVMIGLWLGRRG